MVPRQNPKPRRRVVPLAAPCSACGHTRNWHRSQDDTCSLCNCDQFSAEASSKGGAQ